METKNCTCKIAIDGPLDAHWADYLGDLSLQAWMKDGTIVSSALIGTVTDLAAFIGLLGAIHNLGFTVRSAEFLTRDVSTCENDTG